MKYIIALAVAILAVCVSPAQEIRYQTFKAGLKLSAFKDGENYQWENKNISVVLDYRNGEFVTRLTNKDFQSTVAPEFLQQQGTEEVLEYVFKGFFPITDILNQKNISQSYPVELQLICEQIGLNETLGFDLNVTRPNSDPGSYRIFSLHGKIFNDQVQLPAFEGFDNEIELWIVFNAVSNRR